MTHRKMRCNQAKEGEAWDTETVEPDPGAGNASDGTHQGQRVASLEEYLKKSKGGRASR